MLRRINLFCAQFGQRSASGVDNVHQLSNGDGVTQRGLAFLTCALRNENDFTTDQSGCSQLRCRLPTGWYQ